MQKKKMEKRKHRRVPIDGFSVEISDGIGFYSGTVLDISLCGIRMGELPARLDGNASWIRAVITGHNASYRVFIKPRWTVLEGTNRTVGGTIVEPSWDWADFVHCFEPEARV